MTLQRRQFLNALAASQFASLACRLPLGDDGLRDRVVRSDGQIDWLALRREFPLDPDLIYLNTGSGGSTPHFFSQFVDQNQSLLEQNPTANLWGDGLLQTLEAVRAEFAAAEGVGSDEIAWTENTTSGLYAIGSGIAWKPGDEVIISNHEHLSCAAVWKYLQKRFELKLSYIEMPLDYSDAELLARLERQLTSKTRVCCLSHVDSVTGLPLPIQRLGELLRSKGVLFVCDAAQSFGMLDFRIQSLGVDALATSGHKWSLGPKGLGFMYISRAAQDRIAPFTTAWSFGSMTAATGTRNVAHLLAWAKILEWRSVVTPQISFQRMQALQTLLDAQLATIEGVQPVVKSETAWASGMRTYSLPRRINVWALGPQLSKDFRIEVKPVPATYVAESSGPYQGVDYNALRFSTHVYNHEGDIERAAAVLKQLVKA